MSTVVPFERPKYWSQHQLKEGLEIATGAIHPMQIIGVYRWVYKWSHGYVGEIDQPDPVNSGSFTLNAPAPPPPPHMPDGSSTPTPAAQAIMNDMTALQGYVQLYGRHGRISGICAYSPQQQQQPQQSQQTPNGENRPMRQHHQHHHQHHHQQQQQQQQQMWYCDIVWDRLQPFQAERPSGHWFGVSTCKDDEGWPFLEFHWAHVQQGDDDQQQQKQQQTSTGTTFVAKHQRDIWLPTGLTQAEKQRLGINVIPEEVMSNNNTNMRQSMFVGPKAAATDEIISDANVDPALKSLDGNGSTHHIIARHAHHHHHHHREMVPRPPLYIQSSALTSPIAVSPSETSPRMFIHPESRPADFSRLSNLRIRPPNGGINIPDNTTGFGTKTPQDENNQVHNVDIKTVGKRSIDEVMGSAAQQGKPKLRLRALSRSEATEANNASPR